MANYTGTPVAGSGGASINFKDAMNYTQARSRFQQPFLTNTTGDFGLMIPVLTTDIFPGDKVNVDGEIVTRLAPMIKPTMHPINYELWTITVRQRIIWDQWPEAIKGGDTGDVQIAFPMIKDLIDDIATQEGVAASAIASDVELFGEESLWDYMGLPIIGQDGITSVYEMSGYVSAMPFMAYYEFWYEKVRDQDYQNQDKYNRKLPAFELRQYLLIKPVAIDKDYMSTSRPWPQRNAPPAIPLEGIAPIEFVAENYADVISKELKMGFSTGRLQYNVTTNTFEHQDGGGSMAGVMSQYSFSNSTDFLRWGSIAANPQETGRAVEPTGLWLDERISINEDEDNPETFLRGRIQAQLGKSIGLGTTPKDERAVLSLQHQGERSGRGGNRYPDLIDINFGITIPDATIQRPEYRGGIGGNIVISEVLKTAGATPEDDSPVGSLVGHGVGSTGGMMAQFDSDEWQIMLVILLIKPTTIWYQGIDKFWDKQTRYDYIWPDFVNLGEMAIKKRELFVGTKTALELDEIESYQEQYGNFKTGKNKITGKMRTTLKSWQIPLEIIPGVNDTMSEALLVWDGRLPEKKSIFAVKTEPSFQASIGIMVDVTRALPYVTVPGLETV